MTGGVSVPTRQGPAALTLMQQAMRFDLANGFPLITERSLKSFWRKSIGELCAFINGATTLAELSEFGCDWWGPWATPEKTSRRGLALGSLGPGSYGGAFHDFPTAEGPGFDQFKHLVEQLTELPGDRTHFVSPWIPQYQVRGAGQDPEDHDRALPRLGARAGACGRPAPAHVPALGGRAGRRPGEHDPVRGAAAHAGAAHRDPGRGVLPHDLRRARLREPAWTRSWPCWAGSHGGCPRSSSPRTAGRSPTSTSSVPSTSRLSDYDPHPAISSIPVSP